MTAELNDGDLKGFHIEWDGIKEESDEFFEQEYDEDDDLENEADEEIEEVGEDDDMDDLADEDDMDL